MDLLISIHRSYLLNNACYFRKNGSKCHHIRRRCCHLFSAIIIAYLTRTRSPFGFFISSKLSPCAHNHAREEVAHAGLNYIY